MNKDNKIEMIQLFDAKHPLVSKASLLEAFGYKIVSVDFVTFPEPMKVTFQFTGEELCVRQKNEKRNE